MLNSHTWPLAITLDIANTELHHHGSKCYGKCWSRHACLWRVLLGHACHPWLQQLLQQGQLNEDLLFSLGYKSKNSSGGLEGETNFSVSLVASIQLVCNKCWHYWMAAHLDFSFIYYFWFHFLKFFYNHLPKFLHTVPSRTRGKTICDPMCLDV